MKNQSFYLSNPLGFTLIELLIVIVIIGILASTVIIAINPTYLLQRSRDTKRLADMQNIVNALQLYVQRMEYFPGTTVDYGESESTSNPSCPANNCSGWDTSAVDCNGLNGPFIDPLLTQGFFESVPVDPSNTITTSCGGYHYNYYRYTAGTNGCNATRGDFYVLGVVNMETINGRHPESPGWSCSGRDWQNEFEWVTGRYTK